jgi:hypothetical protein
VEGPRDPRPGQRLGRPELGPARHQPGHLHLGELNVLAAVVGQGNVGN